MFFNGLSHFLPVFKTIRKVSLTLISGKNESKCLESTASNLFKKSDSIGKTKFGDWTQIFFLNVGYGIDFMDVDNFRFIRVLKLVVIIVEINCFHNEVKRTRSLLNGMKVSHWRPFALHLIRMFTVHLIGVFTVHFIGMTFGWNFIDVGKIVFLNGRLWMVVVAWVKRVFRNVACVLFHLASIGKLAF